MKLIRSILDWIILAFMFAFGSYLKYVFILFPLLTINMGTFIFLIVFLGLYLLCRFLPVYHLVSLALFVIGLGDVFYYPVVYQIIYFALFALLIIETIRMLICFISLTISDK